MTRSVTARRLGIPGTTTFPPLISFSEENLSMTRPPRFCTKIYITNDNYRNEWDILKRKNLYEK